jgi:hypothetical protein
MAAASHAEESATSETMPTLQEDENEEVIRKEKGQADNISDKIQARKLTFYFVLPIVIGNITH